MKKNFIMTIIAATFLLTIVACTSSDANENVLRVVITCMSDGSPWIIQFDPETQKISYFEYDGSPSNEECRINQTEDDFWLVVSVNAQTAFRVFGTSHQTHGIHAFMDPDYFEGMNPRGGTFFERDGSVTVFDLHGNETVFDSVAEYYQEILGLCYETANRRRELLLEIMDYYFEEYGHCLKTFDEKIILEFERRWND